ncbi:Hypothetical predicted protein [Marmota monax]|uniref:[2Fe-2S]-binding domain-containing protein n=1 Tax=Marmota monax TaxID=9995 RepID=A0A5E4BM98_MARMO|nr:Hypothetical predicted protein [Marmota monax]
MSWRTGRGTHHGLGESVSQAQNMAVGEEAVAPARHYPVTECLVPICCLYGAAVTTVEGVGSIKTRIHPVQERLAKCHGTQCGFCSPGMVMSIYTLLRNHPEPAPEQIMEALGGESSWSCVGRSQSKKCSGS